jgi:hypothetical protein
VQSGAGNPEIFNITETSSTNSLIVSGFTSGKNYKFKVRTNCGGDHSGWSAYFSFTAGSGGGTGTCDVPSGLTVSDISTEGATLSWTEVSGATSYRINVQNASGNPVPMNVIYSSATNSFTVTGLHPASNYKFKVRSLCPSGKSNWSAYKTFTTAPLHAGIADGAYTIYPNPTGNALHISSSFSGTTEIAVYDLTGKMLQKQIIDEKDIISISTTEFANGIYTVILSNAGNYYTEKIVISK